jgi:hypothetical protein
MTIGSHQRTVGLSQVHLTPKWILDRLGPFDTDPCAAIVRPWDCARINYTERDDDLRQKWNGRVFLNPPFDRYEVAKWVARLAAHGTGTLLTHARTEAGWFEPIWKSASGILFLADRIKFFRPDGTEQPANSGAPVVLCAFGEEDLTRLRNSNIAGVLVTEWEHQAGNVTTPLDLFSDAPSRAPSLAELRAAGRARLGRER